MSPIASKFDYRTQSDISEAEQERLHITEPLVPLQVTPEPLVGTWLNCDHQTRGLVRIMIAANGREISLHAFGACTPNPCDWGVTNGVVYADHVGAAPAVAFTATYVFGFKQTIMVGHLFKGSLMVETFDRFTDGSGRSDYYSLEVMSK